MSNKIRHYAIDTEFNGFFGGLISMALVDLYTNDEFYEVRTTSSNVLGDDLDCWVVENVLPYLGKEPIGDHSFKKELQIFLLKDQPEEIHIYADWPDDIRLFCEWVITGPGTCFSLPDVHFHFLNEASSNSSEVLHNALTDARSIRDSVLRLKGFK